MIFIFFTGHFNGDGHTIKVNISKIQITTDDIPLFECYCALFGVITGGGSVKNLNVEGNISFAARVHTSRHFAGGIAAYLSGGTIENCNFDGSVSTRQLENSTSTKTYAGGIVGYAGKGGFYGSSTQKWFAIIKNCKVGSKSATTIDSLGYDSRYTINSYAGGLTAYFGDNDEKSEISGNWVKAEMTAGNYGATGGIFAGRSGFNGKVSNNTEADPNEPDPEPDPEPEPAKFEMTSDFSDSCAVKAAYTGTAALTGGTEPYTWEFEGGLPPGLKLKISGATASITGKPTETGDYSFTIRATDDKGSSSEQTIDLNVTKPSISGTLPDGVIKKSYSKTLKATGGTAPYTWTKSSGTLPTGLKIAKTTGKISGTPTEAGEFDFKIKVTDANGATATKSYTVTITKPTISGTLSAGTVNKSYSKTLKATGGTEPYTWTKASGTLPTGLKLGKTTGKLSGTPTKAKSFTFKVKVTDANGATATKSYTVKINKASSASSNAYNNVSESLSSPGNDNENLITEKESEKESKGETEEDISAPYKQNVTFNHDNASDTHLFAITELKVSSEDVLSQGTERDEDLVLVRANHPVRFIIGTWPHKISDERVYVDDELIEGIEIKEGSFTLPGELVHDDFKIRVKAKAEDSKIESEEASELESEELYISAKE